MLARMNIIPVEQVVVYDRLQIATYVGNQHAVRQGKLQPGTLSMQQLKRSS